LLKSSEFVLNNKENRWHTSVDLWEKLKSIARESRQKPTEAENLLWHHLRGGQLNGFKFRRQHSLGPYIVDFYCAKAHLIIEVDGDIHQYQKEEDAIRQQYLENAGLKVIRFLNNAILNDIDIVNKRILTFLPD
jgi:very-short-patch-repair endonuclease